MEKLPIFKDNLPESKKLDEIKQEIVSTLEIIKTTKLFEPEFLGKLALVYYGSKKTYRFQAGTVSEVSKKKFDVQEFMQGRRTDFVGINPKKEFEGYDISKLNDRQFLPFIFFEGKLAYDEFVAHEIAHNVFDRQYKQNIGQFEEKGDLTDVSDEYRKKIKSIIIPLVKKYYPSIETERFSFSRQQIAEIFCMLYQREFCKRANVNMVIHGKAGEKVERFANSPENALSEFNEKYGRKCSMDDFYKENHILSLIAAPLIEKEYSEWDERINLF